MRRHLPSLTLALGLTLAACQHGGPPPLQARTEPLDLERFMGDWHVVGFIPIDLPFFSEADAHDAVESYTLREDGRIDTRYRFRRGGFDGPEQVMDSLAWVHNTETRTEWRMQFLRPFSSAYLVVDVDPDYTRAVVGVPSRDHLWLMSRRPVVGEAEYEALVQVAVGAGYDRSQIRRVPQRGGAP